MERHVRLFRNGRNRAVRIPREFDFFGEEATIRKEGDRLVLVRSSRKRDLIETLDYLASLGPLSPEDQMPPIESLPAQPVTFFDDIED